MAFSDRVTRKGKMISMEVMLCHLKSNDQELI